VRRSVALVEQEMDGAPNMLTMRELAPAPDGDATQRLITLVDRDVSTGGETVTRLRTVAAHFEDTVTFFPTLGQWEVWQFINLTGDTHPMHIHLNPFHLLARRAITVNVPEGGIEERGRRPRCTSARIPTTILTTPSTPTRAG
jgi:FtsP/CotA-like multicopper oxidase with cupredoxin domain